MARYEIMINLKKHGLKQCKCNAYKTADITLL